MPVQGVVSVCHADAAVEEVLHDGYVAMFAGAGVGRRRRRGGARAGRGGGGGRG